MINTILWLMLFGVGLLFSFIIVGFIYASIYDWWYQRKYAVWIALQDDHRPPKILSK